MNILKVILYGIIALLLSVNLMSCGKTTALPTIFPGIWTPRSYYDGVARSSAAGFVLTLNDPTNTNGLVDYAFVGTGFDGRHAQNDLWRYDGVQDTWIQEANVPFDIATPLDSGRTEACGFGIGTKGYIGTGYTDDDSLLADFYEFDALANTWSTITPFPGTARYSAVAFSLNGMGYVGTGFDGNAKKDVYRYNPSPPGTWTQIVDFPGEKTQDAVTFVVNGKAYICGGIDDGIYNDAVYQYDPAAVGAAQWTLMASMYADTSGDGVIDIDLRRTGAAGFTLGNYGYITTGFYNGNLTNTWLFDPVANEWHRNQDLGGAARTNAVGFTVNKRAYITTGSNNSQRYDDLLEFHY